MATNPCDLSTIRTNSKCYDCLSKHEKLALKVYFMAQILNLVGGQDYTDPDELLEATACFKCEPEFALDSFEVDIWKRSFEAVSRESAGTIGEQRALIKCLACVDDKALKAAYIALLCGIAETEIEPQVL